MKSRDGIDRSKVKYSRPEREKERIDGGRGEESKVGDKVAGTKGWKVGQGKEAEDD